MTTVPTLARRRLPPISAVSVLALVLVIVGGIYLAAHLPASAPLGPSFGLLGAAGALLLADAVMLSRIRPFDWHRFFHVGGWALLAYCVIGGMLEVVFVLDGTHGAMLVVLTLSLLAFAVDVPMNLAFTVASHATPDGPPH